MSNDHSADGDTTEPQSKSARKRQANELLALGKQLAALTTDQLRQLPLPEALFNAVLDYQRFPSHGAARRQLQYIGRILRGIDFTPISQALAAMDGQSAEARFEFHQLEQWRTRLISEPQAMTDFIDQYPAVDRQQLRRLVQQARTSLTSARQDETQQKQHGRALFRFIRDVTQT